MEKKEEWNEIEVPNEEQKEVEYEIEEEVKDKPESEEKKEEEPELEGIETKGAEKRIRQLIRQRKERDEEINALIQNNEALSVHLRTKDKEVDQVSRLSLDASENQLTDKLELARTVYMEVFEEGEKEKLLKAQEMLNDAQTDLKAVSSAQKNYKEVPVQEPQYQPPPVQQASDPRAEEWAARNNWFGQDNVKTAAALAIDAELKSEGYDPTDNDFYQEIDKRINKAFSQNIEETTERVQDNTSPPAQVVSGSSRSSPSSSNKVKLSKEDVRLAQKWNIPLEQYAAEKLKVSDADGNYTNVT